MLSYLIDLVIFPTKDFETSLVLVNILLLIYLFVIDLLACFIIIGEYLTKNIALKPD